jgi:hypothetical protein
MAWPISGPESSWTNWMPGTVTSAWSGRLRQNSRTGRAKMLPGSARQQRPQPAATRQPGRLSRRYRVTLDHHRRLFWLALGWTVAVAVGEAWRVGGL